MKLVPCPLNGLRPADEFVYGGEVREMPDPATCSDEEWIRHVFHRSGVSAILTITYADPTMTVHQAQAQAVEAARIVHGRLPKER